ncbi:MAG: T9SS type A sorting domain-containing protein [Rhodothermales bacterium]
MLRSALFLLIVLLQVQPVNAQWENLRVDEGTKPALVLGADCTAEVTYMLEQNDGYVRHAQIPIGGLPMISPVDEGYFYGPSDVAISSSGDVFVSYHDHDVEDQMMAVRSGNSWTVEQVSNPGHDGWDNNVFAADNGIVHTSSIDPASFGGRGVEYARRSATGFWTVEGVGSIPIMYANGTSIVVGADDEPVIAYHNDTTRDLELAERSGGTWNISVVDSAGETGRFPSMQLDDAGNLHIVYYQTIAPRAGIVRYAKQSNGAWTFSTVDTLKNVQLGSLGARRIVELEIENDNLMHIAYTDRSVVKYAKGIPGNWTYETVLDETDSGLELGQMVDMAQCANDGLMHMVYYISDQSISKGEVRYLRQLNAVSNEDAPDILSLAIEVYPNPSSNQVRIQVVGDLQRAARLEVVDALGRQVYIQSLSQSRSEVLLDGLVAGVYLVKLVAGGQTSVSSFIVAK